MIESARNPAKSQCPQQVTSHGDIHWQRGEMSNRKRLCELSKRFSGTNMQSAILALLSRKIRWQSRNN